MNPYAYVFNGPTDAADPSGLFGTACQAPPAAALLAVGSSGSLGGRKDSMDLVSLSLSRWKPVLFVASVQYDSPEQERLYEDLYYKKCVVLCAKECLVGCAAKAVPGIGPIEAPLPLACTILKLPCAMNTCSEWCKDKNNRDRLFDAQRKLGL